MRTTVTPQAEGTVRFDGDRYKCLMIRKRVRETVRRTGEQEIYQAVEHAQAKTLAGTACLTCQYDKGCTQGIRVDAFGSETIPSPVRVLSQSEKRILRRKLETDKLAPAVLVLSDVVSVHHNFIIKLLRILE